MSPQTDMSVLPHCGWKHFSFFSSSSSSTEVKVTSHYTWRLQHEKLTQKDVLSLQSSIWTKEDTFTYKGEGLLAIPSSE